MDKCVIVGNGKSLSVGQLDLLTDLPTYACNRINLIYPQTKWRPTYYIHPESFAPNLDYIKENINIGIECYLGEHFALPPRGQMTLGDYQNVYWINDHPHHLLNFNNPELPDEWVLPQLCSFGGSVNLMMQLAVKHGFTELILIGCDLEYKDRKPSHFDPNYEHGGEQSAFYASRNALFGHIQARNWIQRKNPKIKVYNATVGGLLEIWERKRLEDLI